MKQFVIRLALAGCFTTLAQPLFAQESAKEIIAAHIRTQGYKCSAPLSARRDPRASKPNEAVWLLQCQGASYRVRLIPDMAAFVEQLD